MILGLDNGYAFTKTSEGVMFRSTIKRGKDIFNTDALNVTINGTEYVVGEESGQDVADNNKIDSLVTEICTFTAIAKSFPDAPAIDVYIVAGLPVAYYSAQREAFRDKLLSYGRRTVRIGNGILQEIQIKNVLIYPQSAGVVFLNAKDCKNDNNMVIDVGGGTVDVSHFKGLKLMHKATYPAGMNKLYSELVQRINGEHGINLGREEMDETLQKGYISTTAGRLDLSAYSEDIETHVQKFTNNIKNDFPGHGIMDNIFIIGGGGIRLFDKIKKVFNKAQLTENAQFANAMAFRHMGEMKARG